MRGKVRKRKEKRGGLCVGAQSGKGGREGRGDGFVLYLLE